MFHLLGQQKPRNRQLRAPTFFSATSERGPHIDVNIGSSLGLIITREEEEEHRT